MAMDQSFSQDLEKWLKSNKPKTVLSLGEVFAEKSFAVAFLILMFLPSLPLPTGGISHVFELIVMLLALELLIGRHVIWLPKRWRGKKLSERTTKKAIPFIIRRVRWFERFARPRFTKTMQNDRFIHSVGLVVFVYTLAAFLAPPFSGLDTLPSFGVVVISLGLILEDGLIYIMGLISGAIGIFLSVVFGAALAEAISRLFS